MRIEELDTPALAVDLDIVETNLRRAQEHCDRHGLRLRPHTKTHKSVRMARRQVELGASGITVAKLGEAEVMAGGGMEDILIAYPLLGAEKVRRLAALAERCRVAVATDSWESAEAVAAAGREAGRPLGLLVEVDTGLRRVGVPAGEPALELCRRVRDLPGVEWLGLQTYQGHLTGPPEGRAERLKAERERLVRLLEALRSEGLSPERVSGGSTPCLFGLQDLGELTEVRPGTYIYNDANTVRAGACGWGDCALRVWVTVVSTAVPGRLVVDGGQKTFAGDPSMLPEGGLGWVPEDPDLRFVAMNEEHGIFDRSGSSTPYRPGDRLAVIPNHVCTCVNLHDGFWTHRGGVVEDYWPVDARGRVR